MYPSNVLQCVPDIRCAHTSFARAIALAVRSLVHMARVEASATSSLNDWGRMERCVTRLRRCTDDWFWFEAMAMDGFCALAGAQAMAVRLESSVLQQTGARSSQSALGRTAQYTVQGERRPQARCLYVDSRKEPADAQHKHACTTRSRNPHLHEKTLWHAVVPLPRPFAVLGVCVHHTTHT